MPHDETAALPDASNQATNKHDTLPEWSKGVDSSSTSASCVGSNPTGVILLWCGALPMARMSATDPHPAITPCDSCGVRTHAELTPVDLKSTPLTTRANCHLNLYSYRRVLTHARSSPTIGTALLASKCPHRLVVRTSRRGRDNPGSTPGVDICIF